MIKDEQSVEKHERSLEAYARGKRNSSLGVSFGRR